MKKYITIVTMIMLSVATLVGCGKEKANGSTDIFENWKSNQRLSCERY